MSKFRRADRPFGQTSPRTAVRASSTRERYALAFNDRVSWANFVRHRSNRSETLMKWPSITVVDWSSFQSGVVDKIGIAPTLLRSYIYRGQADSAWTLRPSLARQFVEANISAKDALSIELRALSRFREKASEFVGVLAESSMGTIDWWTLMQHHGAPTSVLDWSHSIFVALYFAVTGKPDLDCAIWAVHQKSLMSLASARGGSANDELFTEAAITSEQPLKLLGIWLDF